MIKQYQVWKANLAGGKTMYLRCMEEQENSYLFMPVRYNEIIAWDTLERSKIWTISDDKMIVHVDKDKTDFFYKTAVLEQDV